MPCWIVRCNGGLIPIPFLNPPKCCCMRRVPRETSVLYPHELEANKERRSTAPAESTLRVFTDPNAGPPEVHLLSNGRYHVMITNSGGGYSRWNDLMLTRWREDATRDCWGTYFYLRDMDSGTVWSPTHQPTLENKQGHEAIFSQARAEFRSRVNEIDSHLPQSPFRPKTTWKCGGSPSPIIRMKREPSKSRAMRKSF